MNLRTFLIVLPIVFGSNLSQAAEASYSSIEALGRALYFDVNLSYKRSQACSTCHA
ncbi:MAG: cytochrome c peroxidase, partial [Candidatus Thiodiazotropha sp. 6PLUC10]